MNFVIFLFFALFPTVITNILDPIDKHQNI